MLLIAALQLNALSLIHENLFKLLLQIFSSHLKLRFLRGVIQGQLYGSNYIN